MTDSDNPEFSIRKPDLIGLMLLIKKSGVTNTEIKIANPVPFCIISNLALSSKILLGASADDGHSRMVFDSSGYFKPSYSITQKLGVKIEDSWNNLFLKEIRLLRFLTARCQKCFYLKWCKGGSRYWARINSGNYLTVDPWALKR
jgi:radical SAM protein with 4Fe4S-binding SPASM domain